MLFIARFLWIVSLLGFIAALQVANLYLPETVFFYLDNDAHAEYYFKKEYFFYANLALVALINGLFLAVGQLFQRIPNAKMVIPNKVLWLVSSDSRRRLNKTFNDWIRGFLFCLNLFSIVNILTIYKMHDKFATYSTIWMYVVSLLLTVAWLISFVPLFQALADEE
jgi:hypothetical protein